MNGDQFSLIDLFQEEVRAHTATLSEGLLELERAPGNPRTIEPPMRAAPSLKGAAGIVNLEPAVRLSHVMEDVFVAAQEGRVQLAPSGIDILLESTDVLAGLSTVAEPALPDWVARHEKIVQELESSLRGLLQAKPQRAEPAP